MSGTIRIGTSGWSYDDWVGPFYPPGTAKGEYLSHYATRFDTVEVDSTFYRPPSPAMISGWAQRTPAEFAFALKTPRVITHDQMLQDCDAEMESLLESLQPLGKRLKVLLLQFGYFNRAAFASSTPFFQRLDTFLGRYAARVPLACEIRNNNWLTPEYFDLLRGHRVTAALVEHAWLPPIDRLCAEHDVHTGPFAYVRLIGDRAGIERTTQKWDQTVVDRSADLRRVARALRQIAQSADVLVFINNHYAGHGPATCRDLRTALDKA
ncbi:MAG TPA: DUF72 domain-containing protein [Phycisphaerae bacterium]|nr:DUF72 domain-containing protein [Phycisphaerae bacterium]HQL53445.1 DUF72 domain-containing protein [Phycisphaerae bacterium]